MRYVSAFIIVTLCLSVYSREGTYYALCMPNVTHADYSIRYGK